jgi:hypothetical protein
MYLLDTDHLSLIQRGSAAGQNILTRLTATSQPFATTIVTYERISLMLKQLIPKFQPTAFSKATPFITARSTFSPSLLLPPKSIKLSAEIILVWVVAI